MIIVFKCDTDAQKSYAFLLTPLLYLLGRLDFERRDMYLLPGLAMGALILLRENAMVLLPVVALWLVVESRQLGIVRLSSSRMRRAGRSFGILIGIRPYNPCIIRPL